MNLRTSESNSYRTFEIMWFLTKVCCKTGLVFFNCKIIFSSYDLGSSVSFISIPLVIAAGTDNKIFSSSIFE